MLFQPVMKFCPGISDLDQNFTQKGKGLLIVPNRATRSSTNGVYFEQVNAISHLSVFIICPYKKDHGTSSKKFKDEQLKNLIDFKT